MIVYPPILQTPELKPVSLTIVQTEDSECQILLDEYGNPILDQEGRRLLDELP